MSTSNTEGKLRCSFPGEDQERSRMPNKKVNADANPYGVCAGYRWRDQLEKEEMR